MPFMKQLYLQSHLRFFLFTLLALAPVAGVVAAPFASSWVQTTGVPVSGTVVDGATKAPVGFATVALQDKAGKTITGVPADENGNFTLPRVAPGDYDLLISFVGYVSKLHPFTVPAGTSPITLGSIGLASDSKALEEVVVTGEKDLIQETDDGLVYNAENDITNIGGTAADVLKKVPMLAVDIEGNVEMRGSPKIKILINGKPSTMLADNLAEALQQIPADMIKSVEVITNPSAKYDSEGTAGVVNIITKRSSIEGMTGSVTATTGNMTNSLNTNLNVKKKKLGLRASVGGNFNDRIGDAESDQVYFKEENLIRTPSKQIEQNSTYENNGRSLFTQLAADYEFNEKNSLSASVRVNGAENLSDRTLTTRQFTPSGEEQPSSYRFRDIDNQGLTKGLDTNLNYKKRFTKKGQELEVTASFNQNSQDSDYALVEDNNTDVITRLEQSDNHSTSREITYKVDYTHPISKGSTLEVGLKTELRHSGSDYDFLFSRSADAPLKQDPIRSNLFSYDQDVYSSYFSYTLRVQKLYTVRVGGRYEYTNVGGDFNTNNVDTHLDKPFNNFMPNIMLMRSFENSKRLRLSYSTRIHRPTITQLNPYRNESNQLNIRYGNPDLDAELTHNTELNFSWLLKTTSLNASAYWRQTNNDIAHYQFPIKENNDTLNTTYANLGKNAIYGTSLSTSTRFTQKAQLGVNLNLYYNELNSMVGKNRVSKAGFMYTMSTNASYRFEKDFSAQVAASFNSPRISIQSRSTYNYSYSLGLRKEFFKRKAGMSLNVENFLFSNNSIRTTVNNNNSDNFNVNNLYNRVVRVSFNYRFGKMEFKREKGAEKPRRKAAEEKA
ncbi:hypothetical protein TH63_03870 [Rufibacter radiotolerans]|uniref:TonB-dependent receptor n=2 Tax=Rufibacter radiotolerans TaxID=1379910 RepID=A0A0H4VM32_9BACT|nr:hypothetical protein TH63_03870 [Rufibacter radiotolerans]